MSIVRDALSAELKTAMIESAKISEVIKLAKTTAKKDLYKKKLAKCNDNVANLLIALDKVEKG